MKKTALKAVAVVSMYNMHVSPLCIRYSRAGGHIGHIGKVYGKICSHDKEEQEVNKEATQRDL